MNRILFEKIGNAVYISHLDLMRVFQRAFRRAGFLLKHTGGFNQHAYVSLALPLSVGLESDCELMDFELVNDVPFSEITEMLNKSLPEGVIIKETYASDSKFKDIAWVKIDGHLDYDNTDVNIICEKLVEIFSKKSIIISKKTKRGFSEFDIIPNVSSLAFSPDETGIRIEALIHAQEPTMNPTNIIDGISVCDNDLLPDYQTFRRRELKDKDLSTFR